jgi:RimJ/RimL family protein N-acetyltransferase
MQLETGRLRLAGWRVEDWVQLRPLATDPEVMRYIHDGKPFPDERTQEFVRRQVRNEQTLGYCMWRLLEKEGGGMIGFCGLQPLAATPETEIGWWLSADRWGRGLATEAARRVLRFGFETVGLPRIVAIARAENRASLRVMGKLGMQFEKHTEHRGIPVVMYAAANPAQKG